MKATLMHKNIEVAYIEYEAGMITQVYQILIPEHMPIGTCFAGMTKDMCRVYLQSWQKYRMIPSDRLNLDLVLGSAELDIHSLCNLSHCMGLTDQYWVRTISEDLNWEDVNFWENGFEPSELTLTGKGKVASTPDYETNGSLPKAWILVDKLPIMLKDSPRWLPAASANEVVASQIAQMCNVAHAVYMPLHLKDRVVCATPCFLNNDEEEFASFQSFLRTHHGNTLSAAEMFGMDKQFLQTMTAFDFLIGNTDRHEGNFGMMLNPDNMEFLHPAPLFDSGTCLQQNNGFYFKPFFSTEQAVMNYIQKPFKIPSNDALASVIEETYREFGAEEYTQTAKETICNNANLLRERNRELEEELCM